MGTHASTLEQRLEKQRLYPQKSDRICACMFGYPIMFSKYFSILLGSILDPNKFGSHGYRRYGKEHNGITYTCEGGFIDSSHFRAGMDWVAYLFLLLEDPDVTKKEIQIHPEGGKTRLFIKKSTHLLSFDDRIWLAQRIAYERLTWHEIMSWYYHAPQRFFPENQSSFSPEDNFSNLAGTYAGAEVIRAMQKNESLTYNKAADLVFREFMNKFRIVSSKKETKKAYAQVDRKFYTPDFGSGQTWFDSSIELLDQRYCFKRQVADLEQQVLAPWLIPHPDQAGCTASASPQSMQIPIMNLTQTESLKDYYEFVLEPKPSLFRGHTPLPGKISSHDIPLILTIIKSEMREQLGDGFDNK